MKRLDKSEIAFKVFSYVLLTIFALMCLYPLIYVVSVGLSSSEAVSNGEVVLVPIIGTGAEGDSFRFGIQFDAFKKVFLDKEFWLKYCYTIFYTFYGTLTSMFVSITGAYALSKTRLMWGRGFNFLLTFTMWFNAGIVATKQNFVDMGIDNKWGFIFGMGFNAYNIILLRNGFKGVSSEIEEAATIDGATEFQILSRIYVPMSKSSIVTVAMFYAVSRWNGYLWAQMLLVPEDHPLTVYIRITVEKLIETIDQGGGQNIDYSVNALRYAFIVCSIVPIIIIYPKLQKYFAAGVNVGGVKE